MKIINLATVTADGSTDVVIPEDTPQTRGRDAVLVLLPDTAFDGTIAFLDADGDGVNYVTQLAATDLTGGTALMVNVTVPVLARITGASITLGACKCYLMVGE